MTVSRTARIFLSSTFRDFGEERDLLVRKVFPGLRARLKDRFVELVDVDLRWGITEQQAERGEVLPICLAEIDRSRPFFVGLLGERYGWVPEKGKYPPELVEQRPWLKRHQGGKSVTELEILHGVLNNPKMAGRALFYFRSAAYAKKKGGDYLPQSVEDRTRQKDLKARIRDSGFPVVQGYRDPDALAKRLERDLWKILDDMYPADEVPDAFTREGFRHEAYAVPRRRLYLGGEGYIEALDAVLADGKQRILVEGASGSGKSALIANWLEKRGKKHRKELVHVHYLGATAEASDPQALVRRLLEAIKRLTESSEEIPSEPQALYDSLSTWLAIAHAYAAKRKTKVLIVLDALNGLRDLQDLRWFPEFLPERVRLVVSCLPGQVHEALLSKGDWQRVEVTHLDTRQARELFVAYLKRYNKELPQDLLSLALNHSLSTNPLFLRTLAEELRLFGAHEELETRLTHYLTSRTVDDLFERVLERVEDDCGPKQVRKAMEGIWASRSGLSEYEIQGFANLKPAEWAPIRHALDDSLLESGGRITFAHDYMRLAVSDRYLAGNNTLQEEGQSPEAIKLRKKAHIAVARWFDAKPEEVNDKKLRVPKKAAKKSMRQTKCADARSAEEVPWQYQQAKDWKALKTCLTRRDMFEAIMNRKGLALAELTTFGLNLEKYSGVHLQGAYKKIYRKWFDQDSNADAIFALIEWLHYIGEEEFPIQIIRFILPRWEMRQPIRSNLAQLAKLYNDLAVFLPDSSAEKVTLAKKALTLRRHIFGDDHELTLESLNNYACALPESKGVAMMREAYEGRLRVLGISHPDTFNSLTNLASTLDMCGDQVSGESLLLKALDLAKDVFGRVSDQHKNALIYMTTFLLNNNRSEEAIGFGRQALAISKEIFGITNWNTALASRALSRCYEELEAYREAIELGKNEVSILKFVRGPCHDETVTADVRLGRLFVKNGQESEAEATYRGIIADYQSADSVNEAFIYDATEGLAGCLRRRGQENEAIIVLRQSLDAVSERQGQWSVDVGKAIYSLAKCLIDCQRAAEAQDFLRKALAIAEAKLPPDHPELTGYLYNLGNLLMDQGKLEEGENLLRRELQIVEAREGMESGSVGASLYNLGNRLAEADRFSEAEPLLRREISIVEALEGDNSTSLAQSVFNLGQGLAVEERFKEAEDLFRRAIKIAEAKLPPDHPDLTSCLYALGNLLMDQGKLDEGEELLRRELQIVEAREGMESGSVGASLYNLGNRLAECGKFDEAEMLLRRALGIEEVQLGTGHEDVMGSLSNLGDVLRRAGRPDEAEKELTRAVELAGKLDFGGPFFQFAKLRIDQKWYEEAEQLLQRCLEIRRRKLDPEDETIGEALSKLAEVYRLMGRDGEADEVLKRLPPDG